MSNFLLFKSVDDMPEIPMSQATMSWNKTGSWRTLTPSHQQKTAPCNFNCPAGEDIRGYIELIRKEKWAAAFELLTSANPMPSICGQVCFHPCQANCNRHSFDTEIKVRQLEGSVGLWGTENYKVGKLPAVGKYRVAVVGAGPAGLSAAYYLRRKAVAVDLYDENELAGGILQYGIPEYRLPRTILRAELERMLEGVAFYHGTRVGRDVSTETLAGYDAIFIATGAHQSKSLRIPGEELDGVEAGLSFLKRLNGGEKIDLGGKRVIVIGGGNTAVDVARSAYRLGAKVNIVYRRTESEMPAFAEEIEQLKNEPIEISFLASPETIEKNKDKSLSATFQKMKCGDIGPDGRASVRPIEGERFNLEADIVYSAIGEDCDLDSIAGLTSDSNGELDLSGTDSRLRDKLFFGGDMLPNPRTVSHAIGSGRLAAEKIIAFLEGDEIPKAAPVRAVVGVEDINYAYFVRTNAAKRTPSLDGANNSLSKGEAIDEAKRCFSCGVCNDCNNCFDFCPDLAVIKSPSGYQINLEYCKGCGICAAECPCDSFGMGQGVTG